MYVHTDTLQITEKIIAMSTEVQFASLCFQAISHHEIKLAPHGAGSDGHNSQQHVEQSTGIENRVHARSPHASAGKGSVAVSAS